MRKPHASLPTRDAFPQLTAIQRVAGNRAIATMARAAAADTRELNRGSVLDLSDYARLRSRERVLTRSTVTQVTPTPTRAAVARIGWGSIGTGVGSVALGAIGYALGGVGGAAIGASLGGVIGASLGTAYQYRDLRNQGGLAAFQKDHGGTTQGTLALFERDGRHFMTEQQTNNRVKEAAGARGIEYLDQARRSGFHAEMRFIAYARAMGLRLSGMKAWVSKSICGDCADRLEAEGVVLQTPRDDSRYRNWVSPDTGEAVPRNPTGKFKGRRTEVELLKD